MADKDRQFSMNTTPEVWALTVHRVTHLMKESQDFMPSQNCGPARRRRPRELAQQHDNGALINPLLAGYSTMVRRFKRL